jgi:hypothetical protein
MPKTTLAWNPDEYSPVRERVDAFRSAYPSGRIVTEMVRRTRARVTFRALVYRSVQEQEPAATGWASEREGDGEINQSSCLENAETSAVGRALANLGFHGTRARPGSVTPSGSESPAAPRESAIHVVRESTRDADADALLDALLLLEAAERTGLPAGRAGAIRRALTTRSVAPSTRTRAEVELRAWLRDRRKGTRGETP